MGNQSSSLHQAAAHNDLQEVRRIFAEHDGNVNDRDKVSRTLNSCTNASKSFPIALLRLVSPKFRCKLRPILNHSLPLCFSTQFVFRSIPNPILELFLLSSEYPIQVSGMQDGWTPLHFAAYGGALEVTQFLLVRGANPDPQDVVRFQY